MVRIESDLDLVDSASEDFSSGNGESSMRRVGDGDSATVAESGTVEERELITALEDVSIGVYFFDAELRIRWLNKEALRRIGRVELGGLVGRSWFEVHPEMVQRRDVYDRVLAGEPVEIENARAELPDGDRFYDVRYQPLGDGRGLVGFSIDVTERYFAEQRLRAANRLESLGRLTGGIAHDLNNHLTAIYGYIELARYELGEEHVSYDHLSRVIEVGRSSQVLIQKLLDFARRRPMQPVVRKLSNLVEQIADRLLHPLLDEDLELRFDLEPNLGNVCVDPSAIEQILVNLVVNAREAMPDGGVINIRTYSKGFPEKKTRSRYPNLEPGPYLAIEVSDTGCGMDSSTLESCFEPFFTTKSTGNNSGLGLSTCFGLVRQMSGVIDVESERDRGSTFAILLPRIDDGEPEPEPTQRRRDDRANRGSETILLVEDQDDVRTALSASLQRFGYRVIEAANSGEAILMAERNELPIHVLVTDVIMPRVSGPVLAANLLKSRPELQVIFMSGNALHPTVQGDVDATGCPFISKPFRGDDLAKLIRETVDSKAPESSTDTYRQSGIARSDLDRRES